ncbi:hypothetical protein PVK06_005371 [Gossypium arboreum]|uniref:Uncharacterized protein n=1 Tax=Gossypium arboreum TaxID=29729 RepID=A0ABR0QVR0_GOSAR|nr:hypothetical protein PVK06_005371 [Gossypium arboreum]
MCITGHEIDTNVFVTDHLLLTASSVEGFGDGNKCGEVEADENGEGVEGLNREGIEVVSNGSDGFDGFEQGVRGLNSGVEKVDKEGVEDESDSDSEDENVYLMKVMYFSDGDDDVEFQEARKKLREVEGKTSEKAKETIVDETECESSGEQIQSEVPK